MTDKEALHWIDRGCPPWWHVRDRWRYHQAMMIVKEWVLDWIRDEFAKLDDDTKAKDADTDK